MKSSHSQRLERWLGTERIEQISKQMKGWYGSPIHLLDCPGSVRVCADGDFIGPFERGYFMSAADSLHAFARRASRVRHGQTNVGFASLSDALLRGSSGYSQRRSFNKIGPTGVVFATSTLWRVGATPPAGSAGAAAPGGTAHVSTDTGAMGFANPASGTNHLIGADVFASVASNSLLVYDRLFSVAKTMNSTATEAVTGVPTRYQSATATAADYAGDNYLFVEVGGTALAATAHNWTVCTYTNQAGTAGQTLPSLTGVSGAIVDRLDQPTGQWFAPLATGDIGVKALTQMQCSATVATGAINFVIGHPIGFMAFPVASTIIPFDWLTNRDLAPRIFDDACIALLEPIKPATTTTTYTGRLVSTSAAA